MCHLCTIPKYNTKITIEKIILLTKVLKIYKTKTSFFTSLLKTVYCILHYNGNNARKTATFM